MGLTETHKKKIKWTARMGIASCCILLFAIGINQFREPLLGIKEGYAPHNFSFNILFFLPSMLAALGLGLAVIGRTIKYWRKWTNLKKKWTLIGLSIPAIGLWTFMIIRIILTINE